MILLDANLLAYAVDADSPRHRTGRHWLEETRTTGVAGNLTSDAHLAALAIEQGAPIYSTDRDFGRFPGVEHIDPLS